MKKLQSFHTKKESRRQTIRERQKEKKKVEVMQRKTEEKDR